MEKLIDTDALEGGKFHGVESWTPIEASSWQRGWNDAIDAIINVFLRDAQEVKHGHWTIEDIITYERSYGGVLYEPVYKCSCCGRVTESYVRGDEPIMPEDADFPKFCGNCGAKMDEVEE